MSAPAWEEPSVDAPEVSDDAPRKAGAIPSDSVWAAWRRRYWAAVHFTRRVVLLALMVWCAAACVGAMSGPHPQAAVAGLGCAVVVLAVQGRWVWRRYRRWVV